jgi:calcium-dependent protein kinase
VVHRRDHFDLRVWESVSPEGKSFVQSLLTFQEADRPTAEEALRHPWFDIMEQTDHVQRAEPQTSPVLQNLLEFSAKQKLKQATYAYLVAHATYKSRKKVIDEIFRKVDSNSDGLISRREIEDSFRERGDLFSKEELREIFDRVDIDHNNYINYWEFIAATTQASTLLSNENLKLAFEAFDKNNSGAISADEIKDIFGNPQLLYGGDAEDVLDESVVDAIIQQVDENGDGEISYDEFVKMMQENILSSKRPSNSTASESDGTDSDRRQRHCPGLTIENE